MKKSLSLILSVVLMVASLGIYGWQLDSIPSLIYDEHHYVPAARKILQGVDPQNHEHPPFGKLAIAASMAAWGDNPLGWRVASVISTSLLVVFFFNLLVSLNVPRTLAFSVAALLMVDGFLVVHARVGMLDSFLVPLLVGGLCFSIQKRQLLSGVFIGLAVATKWVAIVPTVILCLFLIKSRPKDLIIMASVAFVSYMATFVPYWFFLDQDQIAGRNFFRLFWDMNWDIWNLQQRVPNSHPYKSAWWSWPWLLRPICYAYEKTAIQGFTQTIILLGGPLASYLGMISLLGAKISIFTKKPSPHHSKPLYLFMGMFWATWIFWGFLNRKLGFYYYFYPNVVFLYGIFALWVSSFTGNKGKIVLALAALVSIAWAIYFSPILWGISVDDSIRVSRSWFRSWI